MDAIDRIQGLHNKASGVREKLMNLQIQAKTQAYENGIDPAYITNWRWPYAKEKA
jgi:xylulose-5-phosphate/fructose-6-phosphate phosphoketolase